MVTLLLLTGARYAEAGSGIVINRMELSVQQVTQLEQRLDGSVIPGRYWLDANGTAGFEGGPAAYNL